MFYGFEEVSDELYALKACYGFSDEVPEDEDLINEIQSKAEEIMVKAQEDFDAFLDSKNLEITMGMIVPKVRCHNH